ncbi:MAG TPA: hypothetical protein VFI24_22200 [Pyrinomonadaceae bacterium]|nr:hypothetical protein [Pyrinomonadaceae bacterium]
MTTAENRWFEIWYDEGSDLVPHYLLIVVPDGADPKLFRVYDPFEKLFIFDGSYEDVCQELREDEYSRVEGRMFVDEIFPPLKQ